MRNTKQKASIQSMNNDYLNLQAEIEGKRNAPGCRRINYNELYGKSITIGKKMQHVGLNWKFKLWPSCLLTRLVFVPKERIYHLTQRTRYMWLPNAMDALWCLFDALGFLACITWTDKARQHQ